MNIPAIPNITAVPIVSTGEEEVWSITLQNNDPANDVYVSESQQGLTSQAGAGPPDDGIIIFHGAGSWTFQFFTGRLYAVAINAPVNLRIVKCKLPDRFFRPTVQVNIPQPQPTAAQPVVRG